MIPSYKIGKTRIEVARILTKFCGQHVAPALLIKNVEDYRGGRNFGFAYSWFVDVGKGHPLCGVGCGHTMTEFVQLAKKPGLVLTQQGEELFFVDPARPRGKFLKQVSF